MTGYNTRMGFNLIESAIVLGVVGLVVAGIWVAAAAVSNNKKINDTVNGAAMIASNIQHLISHADAGAMPEAITSELIDSGVFPADWISDSGVKHPFGGPVTVKNLGSEAFSLRFFGIPQWACIKLSSKISSFQGSGLAGMMFDPANRGEPELPLSPELATTVCLPGNNDLWLNYYYTRNN